MLRCEGVYPNYINGEWAQGSAGTLDIINPATGKAMGQQALGDARDIDQAVAAARRQHESGELRGMRPLERGRLVQAMGQYLRDNSTLLAELLTLEQGKPLWESALEIEGAAQYFEYYGNQASTVEGRSVPLGSGYFDFTELEPYGVSAHIIPWNYPIEMTARSLSAALATGNSCVVKTPELTPLACRVFGLAADHVGLPKGALNIVCGLGHEAGAALSAHPDINQLVFTGSVPTGIAIATAAAQNVVPCVLELGGKSAAIVHDDADLDAFENDLRWGIFFNAGQVCSAMSRVIVHRRRYQELLDRAVAVAESLSVGPGIERSEFGANMGAMVSEQQCQPALYMVEIAVSEGAQCAAGGQRLAHSGAFLAPTVLGGVEPSMRIASEEVFGPVLSVLSFEHDDEAITLANDTPYGLVGGVFTRDLDRATAAARRLRAGQVFVNEWYAGGVETPFGGFGRSGYGREKGREALWNYVQTKNIAIKTP